MFSNLTTVGTLFGLLRYVHWMQQGMKQASNAYARIMAGLGGWGSVRGLQIGWLQIVGVGQMRFCPYVGPAITLSVTVMTHQALMHCMQALSSALLSFTTGA